MALAIKSMPDCCWKYMDGINNKDIKEIDFKVMCTRFFRNTDKPHKDWWPATKQTGAVLFCGAHSGNAMSMYGNTVTKRPVLKSLEAVCTYIEDADIGHIVELPEFYNELHKSEIVPRMWIIDAKKLKARMKLWMKEKDIKELYHCNTRNMW